MDGWELLCVFLSDVYNLEVCTFFSFFSCLVDSAKSKKRSRRSKLFFSSYKLLLGEIKEKKDITEYL